MRIFIICSKTFYDFIPPIKARLEYVGHEVELPNCYDNPNAEKETYKLGEKEHAKFKGDMYKRSEEVTKGVDAVLVLNMEKNNTPGYIGGATFLEMYDAFRLGKKIYMFNNIPKGILEDEIKGFSPIIINGDLSKIHFSSFIENLYFFKNNPNCINIDDWMNFCKYDGSEEQFREATSFYFYKKALVEGEDRVINIGHFGEQELINYEKKFNEPLEYKVIKKRL